MLNLNLHLWPGRIKPRMEPDDVSNWDLGDFGSTRPIGEPVWTYTQVLTPYVIHPGTKAIPAMDFVQFCVLIAVELDKNEWKKLCGNQTRVDETLVLAKLNTIENEKHKKIFISMFISQLKIIKDHLNESKTLYI